MSVDPSPVPSPESEPLAAPAPDAIEPASGAQASGTLPAASTSPAHEPTSPEETTAEFQVTTAGTSGPVAMTLAEFLTHTAALPAGGPPPCELLRRLVLGDANEEVPKLLASLETLALPRERLEWLMGFLENRELKRWVGANEGALENPWRPLLGPARVLSAVLLRGQTNPGTARALAEALRPVLAAGARSLLPRPAAIRERVVRASLGLRLGPAETKTVERLLQSLNDQPSALELQLEQVRGWLTEGRDGAAQARLTDLAARFPEHLRIGQLRRALEGTRYGDVALLKSRVNPPLELEQALRPGLLLTDQVDVWLRVGKTEQAGDFFQHTEIHRRAEIPGVVTIREAGLTRSKRPYIAYERRGENAALALRPPHGLSQRDTLQALRQLLALAHGLGRCAVVLPDAALGRFELDSLRGLWLVETWGLTQTTLDAAREGMLDVLRKWTLTLLTNSPIFELAAEFRENLEHAADFATVRATLDALSRTRDWGR